MPIPFDRNSKFVGRQNILVDIRAAFKDPQKRRLAILRGSIGNGYVDKITYRPAEMSPELTFYL
jgi:hypothetical protein